MPAKTPAIETIPYTKGGWANKVKGSARIANRAPTKAEAVTLGRDMARARKTEHIVKKKNGRIQTRRSYGARPVRKG